jgi:hypothetical protein
MTATNEPGILDLFAGPTAGTEAPSLPASTRGGSPVLN